MEYRFTLEKYDSCRRNRYTCPSCGMARKFTRYVDMEGKITFPGNVGRCDRVNSCGYHYTPSDFFRDNPSAKALLMEENDNRTFSAICKKPPSPLVTKGESMPSFIDARVMEQSLQSYDKNNLYIFLSLKLGTRTTKELFERYRVGTARKWGNSTVFWQIDTQGRVHAGKIMLYDANTGKRVKEPYSRISWVHSELNLKHFNLDQCFFGEHLLASGDKPVGIVESEKTALIASAYIPQYIWLATGGMNGCFNERQMEKLMNRKAVLFPDLGATGKWAERLAVMRRHNIQASMSDYLERNANSRQRENGYDIANFLLNERLSESLLEAMCRKNPALKTLAVGLELEIVDNDEVSDPKTDDV